MCVKRRLLDIRLMHVYLMIAGTKIQFRKEMGTFQFIQELIHDRNRELVFDRQFIESAVVDAESPSAIMLLDQEYGRGKRRRTAPDDALSEHNDTLLFLPILLQRQIAVWP